MNTVRQMLFPAIVFALLAATPNSLKAEKKPVVPKGANPAGPYSPGILSNGTLYVAGQIGRTADNKYPEKFEDEVKQCLDNVAAILKEAGLDFSNAVAVQVYLTDMDLFDRMNQVYMKVIPEPRPARTTVGVARLVGPAKIEITVTADASGLAKKKK